MKLNIALSILLLSIISFHAHAQAKPKGKITDPHILHIQKLYKEKKFQAVIDYLTAQLKTQKNHQVYYLLTSVTYSAIKDDQKAFTYMMQGYLSNPTTLYAREKMQPILKSMYKKFKKNDKFPWLAKYYAVKKLFDQNKLPEAEKLALELLKEKTNSEFTAVILKDIKTLQGNVTSFDSTLRNVISALNNNAPEFLYFELGELLYKTGKFKLATLPLSKAIELNPTRRRSRTLYGASLLYSGDYQKSNAVLAATLKLFPKFSEAQLFYALSFWSLNKNTRAIKELSPVLSKTTPIKILSKAKRALKVMQAGELFLTPEMMKEVMKYLPKGQDPLKEINKKIQALKATENKAKNKTESK